MKIAIYYKYKTGGKGIWEIVDKNPEFKFFNVFTTKNSDGLFCVILDDSYDKNYINLMWDRKYKKFRFHKVYTLERKETKDTSIIVKNFEGCGDPIKDSKGNYLGPYTISTNNFHVLKLKKDLLDELLYYIDSETFKDLLL